MIIQQRVHEEIGPWTFGSGNAEGRFGGAYPCGTVRMNYWVDKRLYTKERKCRSYRRAVRLLRMFLKGYNV